MSDFSKNNHIIFKNLSASTLQHGLHNVKFPQEKRLPNPWPKPNVDFYNLPSTLSKRSTTSGLGQKQMAPLYVEQNAKLNPMPGKYEIDQLQNYYQSKKGYSLGISYDAYKNVYLATQVKRQFDHVLSSPGPGQYSYEDQIGENRKKYTIRCPIIDPPAYVNPAASNYEPKYFYQENQRYKKMKFQGKYNSIDPLKSHPGVGSYDHDSFTQKYPKNLKKIIRLNDYY